MISKEMRNQVGKYMMQSISEGIEIDTSQKIKITGKSYLTNKLVCGNTYNLCVCEDCFRKKFEKFNRTTSKNGIYNEFIIIE